MEERTDRAYRNLQIHLDKMPVRFPRVRSGKDIQILKHFFTPEEAQLALGMSFVMENAETIAARLERNDTEAVRKSLNAMARKGSIIYRKEGELFALVPFVVGMYEFQVKKLSRDYFKTAFGYILERYAFEFLTTKKPQTRIIPIDKKVESGHKIQSYDEYENLIRNSEGRIAVIDCICRIAADYHGKPCSVSDRRDTCLALRDYADMAEANGWGRKLSVEEALELSKLNQQSGFVIQSANDQNPNFLCACCKDCCGLLSMFKAVPRPADYVASNYAARIITHQCTGCSLCVKICPMEAIEIKNSKASVIAERCIGCGVCTIKCRKESIMLVPREKTTVPPETVDHLYEEFSKSRINRRKKTILILRFINEIMRKSLKNLFKKKTLQGNK